MSRRKRAAWTAALRCKPAAPQDCFLDYQFLVCIVSCLINVLIIQTVKLNIVVLTGSLAVDLYQVCC